MKKKILLVVLLVVLVVSVMALKAQTDASRDAFNDLLSQGY